MSTEEDRYAQDVFGGRSTSARACVFCAGLHDQVSGLEGYYQPCPRVKRIERNEAGVILVMEFWPNGDWEDRVVFPSDVYTVEELDGSSSDDPAPSDVRGDDR